MPAIGRTQKDIDDLAEELARFTSLSDDQRRLLSEIFDVAREALAEPVRDQFIRSFTPGSIPDPTILSIKVGLSAPDRGTGDGPATRYVGPPDDDLEI